MAYVVMAYIAMAYIVMVRCNPAEHMAQDMANLLASGREIDLGDVCDVQHLPLVLAEA